jgi:hypothetical protein
MADPPRPPSYHLIGPPDLLHDVMGDFEDIGWRVSVSRWQAVVTASDEDAAAPAPDWPAEVTLARVTRGGHAAACEAHLGGGP